MAAGSNRSVLYSKKLSQAVGGLLEHEGQVELGVPLCSGRVVQVMPLAGQGQRGAVQVVEQDLEERLACLTSRAGWSSCTSMSNGRSWWAKASRHPGGRGAAARGRWGRRSGRCGSPGC